MKRASKTNKQPKMEQRADPRQKPKPTERYIERYRVGDTLFGIEDYLAPGDHFMPTEPHRRFRVWCNGCSIGQYDSMKQSKQSLFDYILNDIIRTSDYAMKTFTENAVILDRLSTKEGIPELKRLEKFAE